MIRRIEKTFDRRLQDFLDYHKCLGEDARAYESGDLARFKTVLCILRVLICDNRQTREPGLAFVIDRQLKFHPGLVFHGLEGIPATNPLSKDRLVSLENYVGSLEHGCISNGQKFTNKSLIWEYSSQDGSHSDSALDFFIARGNNIVIQDRPGLDLQVLAVAKNVWVSLEAMIRDAIKKGLVAEES